jgi:K+-transporting ATPase KdpF subunit
MKTVLLLTPNEISTDTGYIVAVVISLFILGYLLYALVKPEKF